MESNGDNNGFTVNVSEGVSPVGPVWKPDLYRLQQEAPKPRAIFCPHRLPLRPNHYGAAFHGTMGHAEASKLLTEDGDYLVRLSGPSYQSIHTLSIRFNGNVKHYKLFYQDGQHYVTRNRKFHCLSELVADGLITMYIEKEAGPFIELMSDLALYEKSPAYLTLNRIKKKTQDSSVNLYNNGPVDYDKPHNFKIHNFKGLNWCEFCGNFLWGFTAQGVKCEDCGFSAHVKCGEKLPADCCPDLKQMRGVFGIDLTSLVKVHRTTRPFVIDKCIKEVDTRGLDTEGIYRVSGFAEEMDSLRIAFDRDGENADVSVRVYDNISVVAGILKLYLRLLPIPLVTYEAHPAIIRAVQQPTLKAQISGLKDALTLLPPAHFNTLKFLMAHLSRVVDHQNQNKMSSQNLSTVFAPTLMPTPDLTKCVNTLPDMTNEIAALQLLIDNQFSIFS